MKRTYPFPPILIPIAIASIALVLGLALPWWKFGSTSIGVFENGLFPVAMLVPALGLLALLDLCADVVLGLGKSVRVGSFTREQIRIVAAADALALAAAWYFMGSVEIALGYWVSLAGSAVALVAVLLPGRFEMMRLGLEAVRTPMVPTAGSAQPDLVVEMQPPVEQVIAAADPAVAAVAAADPAVAVAATPEPTAVAPAASPSTAPSAADFAQRWFCVLEPQPLLDPSDPSRHSATLAPRTWYIARRREGAWLLAVGPNEAVGWVAEASVQWAPEERS